MDVPPPQNRMDCQYCDEKTTEKLPFCDHHAHPACVMVAHQFRYKHTHLECPTCHAKQREEIHIRKNANGVLYGGEGGHVYILEVPRTARQQNAPVPVAPQADVLVAVNLREQRRAQFNAHRQAGRIPATARFGGIHERNCGHRGCDRHGGVMGVRFFDGRYRCEVHR
jgi:hypothetical protein